MGGSGNQLATSKGASAAILTVEPAAGSHEAAVFSAVFALPGGGCTWSNLGSAVITKEETQRDITPSADGSALLAD